MLSKDIIGIIINYLPKINYFTVKEIDNIPFRHTFKFYNLEQIERFISSCIYDDYKNYFLYQSHESDLKFVKLKEFLKGYNYEFIVRSWYSKNRGEIKNYKHYYIKGYKYNLEVFK